MGTPSRARCGSRRAIALLLLVALLAPVGVSPRLAAAASCTVTTNADSGTGSLREKLADGSCATIVFQAGLVGPIALTSGPLTIGRSVAVTGPGAANLILDGGNTSRVLDITAGTVAIGALTVAHGHSLVTGSNNDGGGGIRIRGGATALTLTDSVVDSNRLDVTSGASGFGGGIAALAGSSLALVNTTVSNNALVVGYTSLGKGGGVFIGGGALTMTGGTIANNTATGGDGRTSVPNGGGVQLSAGTAAITGATIRGNNADGWGAGLSLDGNSSATLTNSAVSNNAAKQLGGGSAVALGSALTLSGTTVTGNTAYTGGGIALYGSLVASGGTIGNNAAQSAGGGVFQFYAGTNDSTATLTGVTISANTAGENNGGGYFQQGGTATLTNGTISGNTSARYGGGYLQGAGTATFRGMTIGGNTAASDGGGFDIDAGTATLTNTTINGNTTTAGDGGGVWQGGGTVTLTGSTIAGNHAGHYGGGVDSGNGTIAVVSSTISGNTAAVDGGGFDLYTGTATLANSTISGNSAGRDGGGLYAFRGALSLQFVTVTGNIADSDNDASGSGGGIYRGTTAVTAQSSILAGNTTGAGVAGDCTGVITSQGHNLFGAGPCPAGGTDLTMDGAIGTVLNPTLADNGGPTRTHVLVAGSPALDAGDDTACAAAPVGGVDQRGTTRPQGTHCDIGAYELVAPGSASPSPSPAPQVALTLATAGGGTGSVGHDPVGGGVGPYGYAVGTVVTITASAAAGSTFTGWSLDGQPVGWANPVTLTMNAAHTLTATFAPTPGFGDVPGGAAYADPVSQLAARGIINGCDSGATPPLFCPADPTLRAQLAALIARAIPGWAAETGPPSFTDNTSDTELMTRVATLQRHGVVRGYQDEVCTAQGKTPPCYGPLDSVRYGQALLFVARAMVAKGYWALQPDDRGLFPDQNGAAGADPNTDQQTLDHRAVVTYVHYAGAPPDVDVSPNIPFQRTGVANGGWADPSSRGWFARALWQALNSSFGVDRPGAAGYVP